MKNSSDDMRFPFTTQDGREVVIYVDDFGDEIWVTDKAEEKIGSIRFDRIEYEDSYSYQEYYRIVWMFLDGQGGSYLRQGIGRECLRLHKKIFDSPIEAADNDGEKKDDGSHLTGDAPGFVSRMKEEGLILDLSGDYQSDDET